MYRSTSARALVAAGLAVASAVAIDPAPAHAADAARSSADGRGRVSGVVVDQDGEPVVGALVNALGPREVPEVGIIAARTDRRTWTDEEGHFSVRQAKPGYLVQICQPEEPGADTCRETARGVDHLITYVGPAGTTDSWVTQTELFAPATADRDLGVTTVRPQGFVRGRIEGAASQVVSLMRMNDTTAFVTEADAEGDYRFSGLAPGRYYVAAGGSGRLEWASTPVTVLADTTVRLDGRIGRGGRLSGVLSSRGEPVVGTDVIVWGPDGEPYAAATTDRDGVYRVSGLTPGTYEVGLRAGESAYLPMSRTIVVPSRTAVLQEDLRARLGAVIRVEVSGVGAGADFRDELRDASGRPVHGMLSLGKGAVTYRGIEPGTYRFVGADEDRYVIKRVVVSELKRYDLGTLRMRQSTLTLRGRTAPGAVVEAMTGDQCLPDGPDLPGSFHRLDRADADGRYLLDGLVPGRYMLGADGWPDNYAPRCWKDVRITADARRSLPLETGGTVSGRLVYAATGSPVITTLSYALQYPDGALGQPTDEHPSRAQSRGATGLFSIDALGTGAVSGRLAAGLGAGNQITDGEFIVIYPFQDGTPYYLDTGVRAVDVQAGADLDLGDVPVTVHGTT